MCIRDSVYTVTGGSVVAAPINVSSGSVYLILYGTGFQAAGTAGVTVTIGGVEADVGFAGMQGSFAGLDQANVLIPASLAGRGDVYKRQECRGAKSLREGWSPPFGWPQEVGLARVSRLLNDLGSAPVQARPTPARQHDETVPCEAWLPGSVLARIR